MSSVSPATALYVNARKRGGFAYWIVCGLSLSIAPSICQRREKASDLVSKMSEKSSWVSVLPAGAAEHAAASRQLIRNRTVGFMVPAPQASPLPRSQPRKFECLGIVSAATRPAGGSRACHRMLYRLLVWGEDAVRDERFVYGFMDVAGGAGSGSVAGPGANCPTDSGGRRKSRSR